MFHHTIKHKKHKSQNAGGTLGGAATWGAGPQYSVMLSRHTLCDLEIPLPSVPGAQGKYALLPRWAARKAVCPSVHRSGRSGEGGGKAEWGVPCNPRSR